MKKQKKMISSEKMYHVLIKPIIPIITIKINKPNSYNFLAEIKKSQIYKQLVQSSG